MGARLPNELWSSPASMDRGALARLACERPAASTAAGPRSRPVLFEYDATDHSLPLIRLHARERAAQIEPAALIDLRELILVERHPRHPKPDAAAVRDPPMTSRVDQQVTSDPEQPRHRSRRTGCDARAPVRMSPQRDPTSHDIERDTQGDASTFAKLPVRTLWDQRIG
jgi:hypothetical protein